METLPEVYPLTSLQIGDIQSYLSRAFLYFTPVSHRIFILVDNRPWLMSKHPKSTRIWQLMVTKYRMSPFTNSRTLVRLPDSVSHAATNGSLKSACTKPEKLYRWFSVIDATIWQKKSLFPVMDLSKALHGFIVFEVAWKDVRGINYLNELQTDTSVALEVRSLKKWDFNGIDQALSCISSWFSGTASEILSLRCNLKKLSDMDSLSDCPQDLSVASKEVLFHDTEAFPEDVFFDVREHPVKINNNVDDTQLYNEENSMKKSNIGCVGTSEEPSISSTLYMDTLLLFKFSDRNLPFKLKQIITPDLRLLTLLESGLPSWVIFFQSYPIFCQFYRPWMCPLARTLYILISLVTVIIGFYDLYKNVPLLKVTAARLCGPLFDWIEAWEMISRIRYLGTMLFLQNLEKALKWCLMVMRVIRPVVSLLTKPLVEPLLEAVELISPMWNIFVETGELYFSTAWIVIESSYSTIVDLVKFLLSPFELLYSFTRTIVSSIYPILCSIWELFLVPLQFGLTLGNYAATLSSNIYVLLKDVWQSASSVTHLSSFSEVTPGGYGLSIWQSLWKDLFSQHYKGFHCFLHGLQQAQVKYLQSHESIHPPALQHSPCGPISMSVLANIKDGTTS
ncbi:uncharacterized protein LOC143889808 isoform X2 [Tasmannia lanceolata]|uniref:uncharacterized protein LOC143889808 isoform X2 n=1 Tax=Tasmannia lanceolata TaxID=3420 RepID=UPI0040648EA0